MKKFNYNEVLILINEVISEFNELQENPEKIVTLNEETVLYGVDGKLKSIDLVTLLVELEYKLEEKFGLSGTLTSEKAMSQKNSPFRTIKTLADYICSLEEE